MGIEALKAYEKEFDELVGMLRLWQLPVRAILTSLHSVVDGLFNGSRRSQSVGPRPEAGAAAGARLSYLVPRLLTCESDSIGRDASDALGAVDEVDPDGIERIVLITYGHFSELMPEVHRGYYAVEGDVEAGFRLTHASPKVAEHEALDIVLAELSLSFLVTSPPVLTELFDRQAGAAPRCNLGLQMHVMSLFYKHYREHLNERPILSEQGYLAAIGASRVEFEKFRAGLFAFADYCKGMARALTRRIQHEGLSDSLWAELLEWVSVNWKETFFVGTLKALTGVEFDVLDRLLALFSIDFRSGHKSGKHAGDGFLPPLTRLEKLYLFNPDLLKQFLPARNILYTLNRTDKKRYDEQVSKYLEPELVQAAADLFAMFSNLKIIANCNWGQGEIDLLVHSASENVSLHIQAKAAIPPQGARMVQAVESRMFEGIEQLQRFRDLTAKERDDVLSGALGQVVNNVENIDVLLSRSCLGTDRVWSKLDAVVPMNLTVLRSVLKRARLEGDTLSLRSFAERSQQETNRLVQLAHPQFVEKELLAGKTTIKLPMLDFDVDRLRDEQIRIWA